jgi:ATP-dependent Clp protease adapter protein ClpS
VDVHALIVASLLASLAGLAVAATGAAIIRRRQARGFDARVELILIVASMEAQARGDPTVTPEHVLSVLLLYPSVMLGLTWLGTSAVAVRGRLDDGWPGPRVEIPMNEWTVPPKPWSPELRRILGSLARARKRQPRSSFSGTLFYLLARIVDAKDGPASSVLVASGVTPSRLANLGKGKQSGVDDLSWSTPERADDVVPPEARVRVFKVTDASITDEASLGFIVHILVTTFGKSALEARFITCCVLRMGSSLVGQYEPQRAKQLVEEAVRAAREAAFPLRIEVDAAGGP